MDFIEYGKENKESIIFLHGGGLSWWNFKTQADMLKQKYHIIIPILNGHAGSRKEFTTIEDNAKEIIEYIDEYLKESLVCICGISLGGQILLDILSKREYICKYSIIESTNIFPMNIPSWIIKESVSLTYKFIEKHWFAKMQFKYLNIREDLYNDYYRDTCAISKDNMIAFIRENSRYRDKVELINTKTKAIIIVGEKENRDMIKSAKKLNEIISNSELYILKYYKHGELSLNHPNEYMDILNSLLENKI